MTRVPKDEGAFLLSIVIPAFQEEARLPSTLETIGNFLRAESLQKTTEIVVVDDGSSDRTAEVAEETGARIDLTLKVIRLPKNRGKGFAVKSGVLATSGLAILVSDADLSTPIEEWKKLGKPGTPISIGSRAIDQSTVKVHQGIWRQSAGRSFNWLVQRLAVPGIQDTQCGFKLFRRDAALEVFSRLTVDRFAWDVEALGIARLLAIEITEVPIVWRNNRDSRVTLLGGVQAYLDLFRIAFRLARLRSDGLQVERPNPAKSR